METDRKIRIVQIDEIRWGNVGAWYAVSLSRGLAALGHRVLFIGKGDLPPVAAAREAGLNVRSDFEFSALRFLSEAKKLAAIVREFGAEVICAHRSGGMNLAIVARFFLPKPAPVIVRARIDARRASAGIGNRFIYNRFIDGVVAADSVTVNRHVIALKMAKERVRLFPGGVDADLFKPDESAKILRAEWGVSKSERVVGLVARLDHVKGHKDFLEAAAIVLKEFPQTRFLIFGEEVNITISELKQIAAGLKIEDKVVFVGKRQDVARCVAALDVGVVSSVGSEALSRVALEYMACAVPVVGTSVGGIPDVVENGVNGYLVQPSAPMEIADAIKKLLQHPDSAKRMGVEGRNKAVDLYSYKKLAGKSAGFYRELTAGRRRHLGV